METLRLIVLAMVLCSTLVWSLPHHNRIEKIVYLTEGNQAESSASSSANAGSNVGGTITKPKATPELYNDIFNIPISVLKAVSQLLGGGGGTQHAAKSKSVTLTRSGDESPTSSSASSSSASSSASASSSSYSGNAGGNGGGNEGGGFFDRIFNIPISTLGAVNKLLVNKAQN